MRNTYISNRFNEVEQAVLKADAWAKNDPELGAYLAGYLVVLLCGVVEDSAEKLVVERAARTKDAAITSFVEKRIAQTLRNPDKTKIRKVIKDFGDSFFTQYRKEMPSEAEDALDSIVNNKNDLAHGNTYPLNLTILDVQNYFTRAKQVFEVLEKVLP